MTVFFKRGIFLIITVVYNTSQKRGHLKLQKRTGGENTFKGQVKRQNSNVPIYLNDFNCNNYRSEREKKEIIPDYFLSLCLVSLWINTRIFFKMCVSKKDRPQRRWHSRNFLFWKPFAARVCCFFSCCHQHQMTTTRHLQVDSFDSKITSISIYIYIHMKLVH